MRRLAKPNENAIDVFDVCISKIKNEDLKYRLSSCRAEIDKASKEFENKALNVNLHTIQPSTHVANTVSVSEMKKVYTDRMAKKLSPGRMYYDKLISSPKHGRCPLCGQRVVSTLDHHLPKARFPSLVVSPLNLIPSCQDCNRSKSENVPSCSENETLHPYYDDVENFTWVKARLSDVIPVSVIFYVEPPEDCSYSLCQRLAHHFSTFNLATLYSSHAAEELASIKFISKKVFESSGEVGLREFLLESAESKRLVNLNSWQSALYTCLSESDWFCQNGYI